MVFNSPGNPSSMVFQILFPISPFFQFRQFVQLNSDPPKSVLFGSLPPSRFTILYSEPMQVHQTLWAVWLGDTHEYHEKSHLIQPHLPWLLLSCAFPRPFYALAVYTQLQPKYTGGHSVSLCWHGLSTSLTPRPVCICQGTVKPPSKGWGHNSLLFPLWDKPHQAFPNPPFWPTLVSYGHVSLCQRCWCQMLAQGEWIL